MVAEFERQLRENSGRCGLVHGAPVDDAGDQPVGRSQFDVRSLRLGRKYTGVQEYGGLI
jgi:hypothetical protein